MTNLKKNNRLSMGDLKCAQKRIQIFFAFGNFYKLNAYINTILNESTIAKQIFLKSACSILFAASGVQSGRDGGTQAKFFNLTLTLRFLGKEPEVKRGKKKTSAKVSQKIF